MGLGGLIAVIMGMIVFALVMAVVIYIYTALAMMTIAKKLGYDKAWLAWIPVANVFLLPILAQKPWQMGFIIISPLLVSFFVKMPVLGALITFAAGIASLVFSIMYTWQIFERRKYPGWLSLLVLVPGLGALIGLVVIGIVAWKDR